MRTGLIALAMAIGPVAAAQSLSYATISAAKSQTGSIVLTLSWQESGYCFGFVPGETSSGIAGHQISITTTNVFFDCPPPPPPPPCPLPINLCGGGGDPYWNSLSVDIGPLGDGTYTVIWSLPGGTQGYPPTFAPVRGSFVVARGAVAIPAMTTQMIVMLAMLLAMIGWQSLSR